MTDRLQRDIVLGGLAVRRSAVHAYLGCSRRPQMALNWKLAIVDFIAL